jgi:hypothetical protein
VLLTRELIDVVLALIIGAIVDVGVFVAFVDTGTGIASSLMVLGYGREAAASFVIIAIHIWSWFVAGGAGKRERGHGIVRRHCCPHKVVASCSWCWRKSG